ncbi:MAG TPA: glycosyltransferase [Pyrinomonadaceae bacterium]|nr:glycosyltransferase [Pyrinomonadaceae bacterium]
MLDFSHDALSMRIFFPLEVFYPSQAGGPANTVYWLAKQLALRGVEPTIVATDKGIAKTVKLNAWIQGDAGRARYVSTVNYHFPVRQTLACIGAVRRADVVQTSSIFYPACAASAFLAVVLGKKLVVSPRNELSQYSLSRSRIRKMPFRLLSRLLLPRRAVFHATSDAEMAEIRQFFGADAAVVKIDNYIELPEQVQHAPQSPYLLFIGRIHPKKGIDRLIRAVKMSRAFLDSDMELRIAGRDLVGHLDELKRIVADLDLADKVQFIGQVEGDEKQRLLADAMWTFMPSISENFGVVAAESLAQGTPVVASKGTPWQVLEETRAGFWIDNDPQTIAAKVDELLVMNREEYLAYRMRARNFAEERLDIRPHVDEWLDLYRSL